MFTYILRRLLYTIPILIGVNLLVFALFFFANSPRSMARQALGEKVSEEELYRWQEARDYHLPKFYNSKAKGTDKVTETIFWKKSVVLFKGDFGRSDTSQEDIGAQIKRRMIPSICIMFPIFLITLFINLISAMIIAYYRGSFFDSLTQFLSVLLMSISPLLFIIGGQYLIAKELRLVPISGFETGPDMAKFFFLPVFIGVLSGIGSGIRLYRTFFLEEVNKDYVRTARAKGVKESGVLFIHVLKNAMIPILTNIPLQLLMLIMGNLLLENFFSIPGLGGYTILAISAQDFSVVRSMVFLGSTLYIIGLLLTDICYSLVDPRIRLG